MKMKLNMVKWIYIISFLEVKHENDQVANLFGSSTMKKKLNFAKYIYKI